MRFRVDVSASAPEIAWPDVHGAARSVVYGLLRESDPALAAELHEGGWHGSGLRPVGISRPTFTSTTRSHGKYMTSGRGTVWLGSPVPEIAAALVRAVARRAELRWGQVTLAVRGVAVPAVPDHRGGQAEFVSTTPVLVKHESRWLLPGDDCYLDRLSHNLRHKADLLGLPRHCDVEVLSAGPRRRFDVRGGFRIGAEVRLRLSAEPVLLDALFDWGLGLENVQGFGWLR
jgi:CRISPR-associated endoribonuclease Cas6